MKCVVLMLIVLLQVDASYQQNILPEHKRRHCNALQTSDIMKHVLPEIRRILQTEAENNRRHLQAEAEKNRRLHEEHVSTLRGVILLRCDHGWLYNDNHCYLFSQTRKKTWQEAREICQNMNASLADIQSDDENRFVKMELNRLYAENPEFIDYFLGGNRSNTEGKWTWIRTGKQIGFTDWAPNEPNNNGGDENCLVLRRYLVCDAFKWNDVSGNNNFSLICKKRVEHEVYP